MIRSSVEVYAELDRANRAIVVRLDQPGGEPVALDEVMRPGIYDVELRVEAKGYRGQRMTRRVTIAGRPGGH